MPVLVKQLVGTILESGGNVQAKVLGQPGKTMGTEGEAREFFRRVYHANTAFSPAYSRASAAQVTFETIRAGIVGVYTTSVVAPTPPPPDPVPPDEANVVGYAARSGPYWQDFAKTIPAVVEGVDIVRVWEVEGGDLVLTGTAPGVLALGGGVQFDASGDTHYTSTAAAADNVSLYVDCDPQPGFSGTNIVVCSSTAELTAWFQPYFGSSQSACGVGGTFGTLADDPTERVRGFVCDDALAGVAFAGGTEQPLVLVSLGAVNTLRIGCSNPTYVFRGIVRSVLLYNVAHDSVLRAEVRLWMAQQAAATTLREVFALHVEGSEDLVGAAGTAVDAYNALHGATAPITVCAAPQTYTLGILAATVTARYTNLLGPNGELAVHVHGQPEWITLLGVTPRYIETFSSPVVPGTGYTTIWSSYPLGESTTLFTGAAALFQGQGFPRPRTMLLGGYLGDADNRAAMVASGFLRDLSQVPPALTVTTYTFAGYTNLQAGIDIEYAGITSLSQPTSAGGFIRIPSTGAVLDYNSVAVARERVSRAIQRYRGTTFVSVEGCHLLGPDVDGMTAHVTWVKNYCIERAVTFAGIRANQIAA